MKYCSQCGHANEDDALFCVKDGCRLEETLKDSQENKYECQVCEKCGFENAIDMKFCGKCGSVLGEDVKSRKKRNSKSHFKFVWVVLLTIGLGLFGASLLYDDGVSELLDDIEGLFEKEYYFNVNMHHSSEIDMDGETINFSVDTDAEWFDVRNLGIRVFNVSWKAVDGETLPYGVFLGKYDWNEDFALKPILDVEFVDDKNFRIIIDENRGYNREIVIEMSIENKGRNVYRRFGEKLDQRGYKGLVKKK